MHNIAIVIPSLGVGGAERIAAMQAVWFAEQGFRVSLVTLHASHKDHYEISHSNIRRVRMQDDAPKALFSYIEAQEFDLTIDHFHWAEEHFEFFELMGESAQKLVIFDHSTYFYPLYAPLRRSMFANRAAAYRNADAVCVLSRHACQMFRQDVPATTFISNPLSYSSDALAPVLDSKTIIAVANWQRPEKRLDRVLEIFSVVTNQAPEARLLLLGPVSQNDLKEMVGRYGIPPEKIEVAGQHQDVVPYYLRARVFLHTSEVEGFGLVLNEAGMHGLPRVAMHSPALDEVIEHGVDGYLVGQGDIDNAAARLLELLGDDLLCQRMSANAFRAVQKFSLAQVGQRWNWLVDRVVGSSTAGDIETALAGDCREQGVDRISIRQIVHDYDEQLLRLTRSLRQDALSGALPGGSAADAGQAALQRRFHSGAAQWLSKTCDWLETRAVADRIEKSGLFDRQWYEDSYPDVAFSKMDAIRHYVSCGAQEGRDPNANFSTSRYIRRHPFLAETKENPLLHFIGSEKPVPGPIDRSTKAVPGNKGCWAGEDQLWLDSFQQDPEILTLLEPCYLGIRQSASQFVKDEQLLFLNHDMDAAAIDYYAGLIVAAAPEKILIQGFPRSYVKLLPLLHERLPKTPVFCIYHGPFTQFRVPEERRALQTLIQFQREGILKRIGLVKKGMAETLRTIDVDACFVMNFMSKIPTPPADVDRVSIGIIGSEQQPLKPLFHQIAACKHFSYDEVRIVGSKGAAAEFCKLLEVSAEHLGDLPQAEMPAFLAASTINLNVSLSECAPMLPLESLAEGVPCLFGANNHYFSDHPYLRSRLVVDVADSETRIAEYARTALEERQTIIDEYRQYVPGYNIRAMRSFEAFLDIPGRGGSDG